MRKCFYQFSVALLLLLLPAFAQAGASLVHRVTPDARTLSEVALYLYGRASVYKQIAEWNSLSPPYRLRLGQKLVLKKLPRLTAEEGSRRLLNHWRKKFGLLTPVSDPIRVAAAIKEVKKQKFEVAAKIVPKDLEFEPPSSQQFFLDGKKYFDGGKYGEALLAFHKSREADSDYLPPWFFEIRTLRQMDRKEEERKVRIEFLNSHPKLSALPFFKERTPAQVPKKGKQ